MNGMFNDPDENDLDIHASFCRIVSPFGLNLYDCLTRDEMAVTY